jgi:DNA-binding response OmpR family regulator
MLIESRVMGKVLIIEPKREIAELLVRAFSLSGYDAAIIPTIEQLDLSGCACLLIDLSNYAWQNRRAIIEEIERKWREHNQSAHLPIVAMTTSGTPENLVYGYPLVHKPFVLQDLVAQILKKEV